jgi:hypothetical protein
MTQEQAERLKGHVEQLHYLEELHGIILNADKITVTRDRKYIPWHSKHEEEFNAYGRHSGAFRAVRDKLLGQINGEMDSLREVIEKY